MSVDQLRDALITVMPVFPLPGAALFPSQQMPLHIFEPRYRQMVRDALDTQPYLVLAGISDAQEGENPALPKIATVGKITAHHRLSDGRYNLILEGISRAQIREEPSERLYRRVHCTLLPEPVGELAECAPTDRMTMLSLVGRLMALARARSPSVSFEIPEGISAAKLSDFVAERLLIDGSARQRVLDALNAPERVLQVTQSLIELLDELAPRSEQVHRWS
ncbi:MAG: LON peptidase substrate-binding domain-containing protein [Deltaproteobacteria bacterium]|nr:LON peptidase substrate-binding domain-containing protein [Deltaproteobacteria bacterium]